MYNSKIYTAKEDYDVVFTIVKEKYSAGWHTIASHLDINKHEIGNINSDHRLKCEECMPEMVDVQLRTVDKSQPLPTWRGLCKALATINRIDAEEIEKGKPDCFLCSYLK